MDRIPDGQGGARNRQYGEVNRMRPIDADAFDKRLENAEAEAIHMRKYVFASAVNNIRGNLRIFPSIEPKRNRGEWVDKNGKAVNPAGHAAYCSACGEWSEYLTPFCGWCGAEMAGFEEVEENDKTGSD